MTDEGRKKRMPGPSSRWELFYCDTFDIERPSFLVEDGTGAHDGLCALWAGVLENGIMEDGRATFSSYELRFGESALERVTISVHPFENTALVKLHRWVESSSDAATTLAATRICGLAGSLLARVFKCAGRENKEKERTGFKPLVRRIAAIHLLLIEKSDRWVSDLVDVSGEAKKILDWIEPMNDPEQLQSDLERILPGI